MKGEPKSLVSLYLSFFFFFKPDTVMVPLLTLKADMK